MNAALHHAIVVAWDLRCERGEIEFIDGRRLPVSGIYFNGFSSTPHSGQQVRAQLEPHAGGVRVSAVFPAVIE